MELKDVVKNGKFSEAQAYVGDVLTDAAEAVLVIDQATIEGFPSLMVLMPNLMPIFVWIVPSQFEAKSWQKARMGVEDTFVKFGAACRSIESCIDLKKLVDEIAQVQPKPLASGAQKAEQQAANAVAKATAEQIANGEEAKAVVETAEQIANKPAVDMSFLD